MSAENYEIVLNDVDPTNLGTVKDLLETRPHLFSDYLLAGYGGDARYSVIDGSFEVIGIGDGFFEHEVRINFYAECSGMNDTPEDQGMLEYEVRDGNIHIEVDEAAWRVDNQFPLANYRHKCSGGFLLWKWAVGGYQCTRSAVSPCFQVTG